MAKYLDILKKLIGEENTDEAVSAVKQATSKLDKAGVTRKKEETTDGGASTDSVLAALDSVGAGDVAGTVESILKVIDELGGTESLDTAAGGHAELVAKLIQALAAGTPAVEETMQDGEDEEDMLPGDMTMKSAIKSLAAYAVHSVEDMGDLAKAQMALTETVNGLSGSVKQMSELDKRLKNIEELFKYRPRSASKSSVTIVSATEDGEDLDGIKKEMEGSTGEKVQVLGLKVNKRKDATYK